MPSDKAPGTDGFTRLFFKTCWEIIKDDITAAINSIFSLNSQGFERLNSANIILFPKKGCHARNRFPSHQPDTQRRKNFHQIAGKQIGADTGLLSLQMPKRFYQKKGASMTISSMSKT
jgi:hypothetical protein